MPVKFLKHLEGHKGLYEIRVEHSNNIFRIFCCFDKGMIIVLFNGYQKKTKFYKYDNSFRNFIGLAPRFDLKLIAGYNKPKYYVMLVTDFDNKSFRFN